MNTQKESWAQSPMALTEDNTYFPDLRTLTPRGVNVSLDKESSALRDIFKSEYERLLPYDSKPQHRSLLARRLLYMVDRAVLLMYLDQSVNDPKDRAFWYMQADKLIKDMKSLDEPYLLESATALKAVLGYQDRGKRNITLEKIADDLKPIYERGRHIGNRMVFALCADYLSLCYLHSTFGEFRKLKDKNGSAVLANGFDMRNPDDMTHLHSVLIDGSEENFSILDSIVESLKKAVIALIEVVECEDELIGATDKWYLWKSYAEYNWARCEWLLYFIQSFTSDRYSYDVSNWYDILERSVYSRQNDYKTAIATPGFPQVLSFNFQAEYFSAQYNYKIITLVAEEFLPNFTGRPLNNEENAKDWLQLSSYLGDTLGIITLMTTHNALDVKYQTKKAIQTLATDSSSLSPEQIAQVKELLGLTEDAEISKDKKKRKTAEEKWAKVREWGEFIFKALAASAPYITEYWPGK